MSVFIAVVFFCALVQFIDGFSITPNPSSLSVGNQVASIRSDQFKVNYNGNSALLQRAIQRYLKYFFIFGSSNQGSAHTITISTTSDSEKLELGIDESYTLTVETTSSTLKAQTVFGALKGLETFYQIIDYYKSSNTYQIARIPMTVNDSPRFKWRGLLIDSARHFLNVSAIKRQIDALSFVKMNTLHWHITDAQSFPIYSPTYPNLSLKGAYDPSAIYSTSNVQDIVNYGLDRGIRVVPEFDVPGHAASWGKSDKSLVVDCPKYNHNINNIPLDATQPNTYTVLKGFLNDMAKLFQDAIHLGGDEIVFGCWITNAKVYAWMQSHGMSTGSQLAQYFVDNLYPSISRQVVVWQDLFDNGLVINSSTIIQVWRSASDLKEITAGGYRALLSAGWYLNEQVPNFQGDFMNTWIPFYQNDPTSGLTPSEAARVLGGEAALWGEHVDDFAIDSMIWPRAAAVAERLWSPQSDTDTTTAQVRIEELSCRLQQRGVGSAPLSPGYCPLPY